MKRDIMASDSWCCGSRVFVLNTTLLQFIIRALRKNTGILMSLCILLCSLQVAAQRMSPNVTQPLNPPGPPGPVSGPSTVVAGGSATFTVTAASGTVSYYAWSLSDPSAGNINGTGTSAVFQPFSSYGYQVNFSGHGNPSLTYNFVTSGTTTIQVPVGTFDVSIYPTAAYNMHTISMTGQTSVSAPRASYSSVSIATGSSITISI